jgi:proline racemase
VAQSRTKVTAARMPWRIRVGLGGQPGTATSASRLAGVRCRVTNSTVGELALNQPITIESIVGRTMTVQVVANTEFGPQEAVVPEVGGSVHITGRGEFWFDPEDPLRRGFIFR